MENGQPQNLQLQDYVNKIKSNKSYLIGFAILIISTYFTYTNLSFISGFIIGVICILCIEIIILYYYLGMKVSTNQQPEQAISNQVPPPIIEDNDEVAEEENKNDIKIIYRSLKKNKSSKKLEHLSNLYIDQNFYCCCKLNSDNFEKPIRVRIDDINNFTRNIVRISYNFSKHISLTIRI
jgi:hypothetical protein